jgi:hypothetical protein
MLTIETAMPVRAMLMIETQGLEERCCRPRLQGLGVQFLRVHAEECMLETAMLVTETVMPETAMYEAAMY